MLKDREERQSALIRLLSSKGTPISGSELARQLGVTRQVVVHDIAILRATGEPIFSTPQGYRWIAKNAADKTYILAVDHPPELTSTELFILVDHGIEVLDVIVEHPLYGELRGGLQLASREDVKNFLEAVKSQQATLLSSLTDGAHMHTVRCRDESALTRAVSALSQAGIGVTTEF